jgi:alpha,alpha-trehalose phosphorylase
MIHHVPHRPPFRDFPPDEWNVIEKAFHPEFLAQLETMLALGNGYLGMRGCPKEGGPMLKMQSSSMGFTKLARSYTRKTPTASQRLARRSSV